MSDNLLTIIIPAYNAEKYIACCIESVINQTKQNYKLIIVNDGSTDSTENICLYYKNQHGDKIEYYYQENHGQGEARNNGLLKVDTPYVTFLDSDDWLNIKYVEEFEHFINKTDQDPDIIFTLPWILDTNTNLIHPWLDKELFDRIFYDNYGLTYRSTNAKISPELYALEVNACRKIYKMSFLKRVNFSFPKDLKWEDVPGHFYLLHYANSCMALPEIGFFYRINHGGQTTTSNGKNRMDTFPIFYNLIKMADDCNFSQIERAYIIRLLLIFLDWGINVVNTEYITPFLKECHTILLKVNSDDIKYYLNYISYNKDKDSKFISDLIGPNYMVLDDYIKRENQSEMNQYETKKKNLIKGGLQCICDHGISYTVIYTFRKYILKSFR